MKRVSIPALRALEAILPTLPRWARFTYQIHMPSPANGFFALGSEAAPPVKGPATSAPAATAAMASSARVFLRRGLMNRGYEPLNTRLQGKLHIRKRLRRAGPVAAGDPSGCGDGVSSPDASLRRHARGVSAAQARGRLTQSCTRTRAMISRA